MHLKKQRVALFEKILRLLHACTPEIRERNDRNRNGTPLRQFRLQDSPLAECRFCHKNALNTFFAVLRGNSFARTVSFVEQVYIRAEILRARAFVASPLEPPRAYAV